MQQPEDCGAALGTEGYRYPRLQRQQQHYKRNMQGQRAPDANRGLRIRGDIHLQPQRAALCAEGNQTGIRQQRLLEKLSHHHRDRQGCAEAYCLNAGRKHGVQQIPIPVVPDTVWREHQFGERQTRGLHPCQLPVDGRLPSKPTTRFLFMA